ncbi:hypothetical protein IE81DRAFT_349615 [Ceraceosorus guamensis]|uniref:Uncharacterized protein n=1 Tax=Ceraceosorus guamensis TaxID=1522189 RepID=A0A316VUW0_9BASI|nr:hypothetical protein IE81DRAFT_349615 [Ceraceosorus guamensis]PWN40061.1 hypothetical protein IE81DRAFT_349615 [Ceraceosorus guamensis]
MQSGSPFQQSAVPPSSGAASGGGSGSPASSSAPPPPPPPSSSRKRKPSSSQTSQLRAQEAQMYEQARAQHMLAAQQAQAQAQAQAAMGHPAHMHGHPLHQPYPGHFGGAPNTPQQQQHGYAGTATAGHSGFPIQQGGHDHHGQYSQQQTGHPAQQQQQQQQTKYAGQGAMLGSQSPAQHSQPHPHLSQHPHAQVGQSPRMNGPHAHHPQPPSTAAPQGGAAGPYGPRGSLAAGQGVHPHPHHAQQPHMHPAHGQPHAVQPRNPYPQPKIPSEMAVGLALEDEHSDFLLDELDRLSARDLAMARYTRNHSLLGAIFDARRIEDLRPSPSPYAVHSISELQAKLEKETATIAPLEAAHRARVQEFKTAIDAKTIAGSLGAEAEVKRHKQRAASRANMDVAEEADEMQVDPNQPSQEEAEGPDWARTTRESRHIHSNYVRAQTPEEIRKLLPAPAPKEDLTPRAPTVQEASAAAAAAAPAHSHAQTQANQGQVPAQEPSGKDTSLDAAPQGVKMTDETVQSAAGAVQAPGTESAPASAAASAPVQIRDAVSTEERNGEAQDDGDGDGDADADADAEDEDAGVLDTAGAEQASGESAPIGLPPAPPNEALPTVAALPVDASAQESEPTESLSVVAPAPVALANEPVAGKNDASTGAPSTSASVEVPAPPPAADQATSAPSASLSQVDASATDSIADVDTSLPEQRQSLAPDAIVPLTSSVDEHAVAASEIIAPASSLTSLPDASAASSSGISSEIDQSMVPSAGLLAPTEDALQNASGDQTVQAMSTSSPGTLQAGAPSSPSNDSNAQASVQGASVHPIAGAKGAEGEAAATLSASGLASADEGVRGGAGKETTTEAELAQAHAKGVPDPQASREAGEADAPMVPVQAEGEQQNVDGAPTAS